MANPLANPFWEPFGNGLFEQQQLNLNSTQPQHNSNFTSTQAPQVPALTPA